MGEITHLFVMDGNEMEYCYNIGSTEPLTNEDLEKLKAILTDGLDISKIFEKSQLLGNTIELGPRMNYETPWSSNMVSLCRAVGLEKVNRVERSRRYVLPWGVSREDFIAAHHDRMMECEYLSALQTFSTGIVPQEVYNVPLIELGPDALKAIPGISMDDWDRRFYYNYFVMNNNRNPTIVEIMDLNNANSEHSRHGYFNGKIIIDGQVMPKTLFEVVTSTWEANSKNSVIAFKDNSSVINGRRVRDLVPANPGMASRLFQDERYYHLLLTAETHNFPTGVAPFPGAETGTGGRIRDVQATGKGGLMGVGTAGYCVSNLHVANYDLPWELESERPENLASGLQILIDASNGASRYGNEIGEPVIMGFARSFDLRLGNGERWGFIKPIMFTAGVGQIDDRHIEKSDAEEGMLIVQIGGPAYRVGFGGGAASSLIQGDQDAGLDFNAVQRGNAEMEQKMNRVVRACVEMGDKNPIVSIHDQGAGGPANVLKELVEKSGGTIDIRKIKVGDPTMSVLEIWVAEYQERNGLLIREERIDEFISICEREKVNCEVLGFATTDGKFVVHDSNDGSTPVNIDLHELMGGMPQKTFEDKTIDQDLRPLDLPEYLTVEDALEYVLRLVSVGSKKFLTNKVDRSVTGRVAAQQCCGPLQLTVGDVGVMAQSLIPNKDGKFSGVATSIGEQPIKMLVNPAAGARMAVGEAITNMAGAKVDGLDFVKCSANWMWAPKLPGEGAAMYSAAIAKRNCMIELGIAVDGGKDSLSMATRVGTETVKSPRELVISTYVGMEDITKVVTPDIKKPGESQLIFIDLASGKNRLGGSALAQVYGQIGDESPDMDDPELVKRAFNCIQSMIDRNLILACHDRSDGGLVMTLLEMAFAGNCGLIVDLTAGKSEIIPYLFSEELGLVIECHNEDCNKVLNELLAANIPHKAIGEAVAENKRIEFLIEEGHDLNFDMQELRQLWEETSYQLERLQANPVCVEEEKNNIFERSGPKYKLTYEPKPTAPEILQAENKPMVCVLREEGSNSDREMAAAFEAAGFEPWDVTMTDLLAGRVSLSMFRGLVAVGGFSYADVPQSAKGWAATILFNEKLRVEFDEFYNRPDTFSLGVCNGCQLFGLLGWVPWCGIAPEDQPRFVYNDSGRFESRWSSVKILTSPSILFRDMEGSILGVHVDHGEGKLIFPNDTIRVKTGGNGLFAMAYVGDDGKMTDEYPFCPSGSDMGITALTTPDGRHTAMMPHPERAFLKWQWHFMPEQMKKELEASPWLKMFQNAYEWCMKN